MTSTNYDAPHYVIFSFRCYFLFHQSDFKHAKSIMRPCSNVLILYHLNCTFLDTCNKIII